jgi:hypothetical protein
MPLPLETEFGVPRRRSDADVAAADQADSHWLHGSFLDSRILLLN